MDVADKVWIEQNWKERTQLNLTWHGPSFPILQLKMLGLREAVNETQESGCAELELKTKSVPLQRFFKGFK